MPSTMTIEHRGLLTGEHFMLGDHACAEGAILRLPFLCRLPHHPRYRDR